MKYFIWGGIIFGLDAVSKWAAKILLFNAPVSLVNNWISLQLFFNDGIAFSLPVPRFLQIFLTLFFLVGFYFWGKKYFELLTSWEKWGSVLLVSGTLGNLWERIIFGHVTDFISIWIFPVFNIADICISLGVFLWILGAFKNSKK